MSDSTLSRRELLRAGGGLAATALVLPTRAPAFVRSDRPALTHGVQSGDVTARRGVVWARGSRPSPTGQPSWRRPMSQNIHS